MGIDLMTMTLAQIVEKICCKPDGYYK